MDKAHFGGLLLRGFRIRNNLSVLLAFVRFLLSFCCTRQEVVVVDNLLHVIKIYTDECCVFEHLIQNYHKMYSNAG